MFQKKCQFCKGDSYSAYNNPHWCCPYCGKDIGDANGAEGSSQERTGEKQKADPRRSAIERKNIISIPLYTKQDVK